jgi:hypothetical protein
LDEQWRRDGELGGRKRRRRKAEEGCRRNSRYKIRAKNSALKSEGTAGEEFGKKGKCLEEEGRKLTRRVGNDEYIIIDL